MPTLKKKKRCPINSLAVYFKGIQTKTKASRKKAIVKIRMEINEIENRNTIELMKSKLVL